MKYELTDLKKEIVAAAVVSIPSNSSNTENFIYQEKLISLYAKSKGISLWTVVKCRMNSWHYREEIHNLKTLVNRGIINAILIQDRRRLFIDPYDYLDFEAYCTYRDVRIIEITNI